MLAFSEDDSLRSVRGCRKLHPRLLKSVAFSDKAILEYNKYIIPNNFLKKHGNYMAISSY